MRFIGVYRKDRTAVKPRPSETLRCVLSEFVPQSKLHDTGLRQQAGVSTERTRHLLQPSDAIASRCPQARQDVESVEIGHVENLPAELQTVAFPRHLPALAQGHIQTGVAIPADHISRTAFARERMPEVGERSGRVGEHADRTIWLFEMAGPRPGDQLSDTLLVPVSGPEITVIHGEGEAAGPAGQARKLPAPNERIQRRASVALEVPSLAERQLGNPVGVDLMGGVEV